MKFQNVAKMARAARKKSGLTQTELAKEIGFGSPQFVSNWERGLCSVPDHVLKDFSNALDIPYVKILNAKVRDYRQQLVEALR